MEMVKNQALRNMNKNIKNIWNEFVYGGHLLALGDAIAMYVIGVILGIPVTWHFLIIIYLCVFSSNLFNRSDEANHDKLTNPVRVKVMKKYMDNIYPITSIALLIVIGFILHFRGAEVLLLAVFIFLISLLYTMIFKKMTMYIIGFKSIVAATFYSMMVLLLVFYHNFPINMAVILMFIFYYVRIFISNAACDIKDIESDKKRGLRTIYIAFGERKGTWFLNIINILSGLMIAWGVYANLLPTFSLALLVTIPYAIYYFYLNSKTNCKEFYTNAVVDGEFLFWLPFMLIGRLLFL